ncbi:1-acyl-sn-glycerol-3-phosphate acyltransferase [Dysgonomonas sp. PFB1-18]|uniref:lysophospholipid acyltransferase family protein n=1 Tax=unclassified Dysgonomonas TaxID=2630389 RepID=UPI0024737B59|nr:MULTISPECIES: lysophospholipid acyltransferase family protein [unclassified Dysgonomonas]MDH6309512.1 1-acyl-sn-glycerol-3-phosphate acyltransferase [Dysgonomonas sp. PF1-14]MDH6339160.1 1-acyl-sn-glycerol-3-phosphate acyltransferase [Dysgonomonas sp. PF1-16]MDH6380554.1 1-acyl-sn-glycerol-3-phosphate acyltransferase [Dysgonomonas sp. PFB1-18]MDH6398050.1 1-acyl-sn-glycerol-3-phosphate acyltransferase [Dysgonomonas sp. PF1-23]
MKKRFLQSFFLRIIYKGFFLWFLRLIIGVRFGDNKCLKNEEQFIILANHSSHLDTLSLLASLPGKTIWKVKPVAAEDYFGNTRLKAAFSNYFINTLLISRKGNKEGDNNPIKKMLDTLDEGYSLILFPEGTRGTSGHMDEMKPGIARILSVRPHIKYIPVYLTGMGRSLPKGEILVLPYEASVNYGKPTLANSSDIDEIMRQIASDFREMEDRYRMPVDEDED